MGLNSKLSIIFYGSASLLFSLLAFISININSNFYSVALSEKSTIRCDVGEKYKMIDNILPQSPVLIKFNQQSAYSFLICVDGKLSFDAYGRESGGEFPLLGVVINNTTLYSDRVSKSERFSYLVKRGDIVTVGNFDFDYVVDSRIVSMQEFKTDNLNCDDKLKIIVPIETGGQFFPSTNSASLATNWPMTIRGCKGAEISFWVSGQRALGEYPILRLQRIGAGDVMYKLSNKRKKITFYSESNNSKLNIVNPYTKVVSSRDLYVKGLDLSEN